MAKGRNRLLRFLAAHTGLYTYTFSEKLESKSISDFMLFEAGSAMQKKRFLMLLDCLTTRK